MVETYRLLEGIEYRYSYRLEVTDIAGDDRQAVLKCGGGNEQIRTVVTEGCRQLSPSPRRGGIHGKNSVAVPAQHAVQPES